MSVWSKMLKRGVGVACLVAAAPLPADVLVVIDFNGTPGATNPSFSDSDPQIAMVTNGITFVNDVAALVSVHAGTGITGKWTYDANGDLESDDLDRRNFVASVEDGQGTRFDLMMGYGVSTNGYAITGAVVNVASVSPTAPNPYWFDILYYDAQGALKQVNRETLGDGVVQFTTAGPQALPFNVALNATDVAADWDLARGIRFVFRQKDGTNIDDFSVDGIQLLGTVGELPVAPPPPPPPPPRTNDLPNVIFVIVDDMGYSDLGCYGSIIETPNLDRLATEGMRFRQFFNNAKCETSRAALMSGVHHRTAGLTLGNSSTLGEAMRLAGYRTYSLGKWHLGDTEDKIPVSRGFEVHFGSYGGGMWYFTPLANANNQIRLDCMATNDFVTDYSPSYFNFKSSTRADMVSAPADYYVTDALGNNTIAFIDDALENHSERPFFVYLGFNAPHTPTEAPEAVAAKYRSRYTNGWEVVRQEKWERQKALGIVDPHWQLPNFTDDIPDWNDLTQVEKDFDIDRYSIYSAQVDVVDQNIGKIMDHLEALDATTHPGILTNTVFIFCSDNGCQGHGAGDLTSRAGWATVSNTPFRYYKQSMHNGGIAAPLIVWWPGKVAPNTITDEPAHISDIMATLVDLTGIDYNSLTTPGGNPVPPLYGSSLLPVFYTGSRTNEPGWAFELSDAQLGYIGGNWKIVSENAGPWRLFNLTDDRTETRNLRWLYPDIAQELAVLYDLGNPKSKYASRNQRFPFSPTSLSQDQRYWNPTRGMRNPGVGLTLQNIGTVANHYATDEDEYYRVSSASTGIGGGSDNFTYFCKGFFGDGELRGYLDVEMENAGSASRTGLMLRESFEPGSPFVMTGWKPSGEVFLQHRAETNGPVATVGGPTGAQPPFFVRVKRSGHLFTASYSSNLYQWIDFGTITNAMAVQLNGGIAVSSGSTGTTTLYRWRDWENADSKEYPNRARLVDGLPEKFGYALGADQETDATGRLPRIGMTNVVSTIYPELTFTRRTNLEGYRIGFMGGETLDLLIDDTTNWVEIAAVPGPESHSEQVTVRRLVPAEQPAGFFKLVVSEE